MIEDGGLRIAVLYLDRQSSNIKPHHGGAPNPAPKALYMINHVATLIRLIDRLRV
jgi:hypothetical protein